MMVVQQQMHWDTKQTSTSAGSNNESELLGNSPSSFLKTELSDDNDEEEPHPTQHSKSHLNLYKQRLSHYTTDMADGNTCNQPLDIQQLKQKCMCSVNKKIIVLSSEHLHMYHFELKK